MNLRDQIMRQAQEYAKIRGMQPDTLYLAETAFLYLLMQMHEEKRDEAHCTVLDVAVQRGAVEAARQMRFMGMRVVIKEETSKSFFVRHTGEPDDASKPDLSIGKPKSLFAEVFGKGGLFDQIFGGHHYE